jgi:uncharacterized phage protein gp47/JayE
MSLFQTQRYEQILTQMIADVVARSDLSDISDSSVFKHLLAAAARSDDEIYYQMGLLRDLFDLNRASGDDLDARAAEIQPGSITRNTATAATGSIVFSRSSNIGTVNIPIGTKVKTATGVEFETTTTGQITPTSPEQVTGHGVGYDSGSVAVVAVEPAAAGNVATGTIVKLVDKPTGVESVTNLAAATGGSDEETDDVFRSRIKSFLASLPRSTVRAIESALIGQSAYNGQKILYAKLVEDELEPARATVYVDDGSGTAGTTTSTTGEVMTEGLAPGDVAVGGEVELYLNSKPVVLITSISSDVRGVLVEGTDFYANRATGRVTFTPGLNAGEQITAAYTYYTGLIALAQKIIDGDETDPTNYPGYRAAGVYVLAVPPVTQVQSVACTLAVQEGYDDASVKAAVATTINQTINNLGIGDDVLRAVLIRKIMAVQGVFNVVLTTPVTDVAILDNEIARTTSNNILVV